MAKFITLTKEHGNTTTSKILINADRICYIEEYEKQSLIYLEAKEKILVLETKKEIEGMLNEGSNTIAI